MRWLPVKLFGFLKMLIIFYVVPVSAPGKAMLQKQFAAEIVLVDFVGKSGGTVGIG